jgi:hypothetical protein
MTVQNRLTALERLAGDAIGGDIPALIYFIDDGSSEYTPDKHEAFKRYKEQWQDDSRYTALRSINSFTELEAYAEQHNLQSRLTAVQFIDKPTEQAR